MDKREKMQAMDKMLRELEDIKNSQTSLLKKIAQLEAENINVGLSLLDNSLPNVHEHAANTIDTTEKLMESLEAFRNDFVEKHKLNVPEETTV